MIYAVGDRLRENRNTKNLTIEEVSAKTRISKGYIEAMENENYDVFPAKVYLLNFMKKYSEFLGLDTDAILHRVRSEYNKAESVELSKLTKATEKTGSIRKNRKVVAAFLLLLVIAAGLCAVLRIKAVNPGGGSEKVVSTAVSGYSGITKKGIDVVMATRDKTWVRATVDGKHYLEEILPAGYERKLSAEKELKLRIGNVYGIDLWHGGEKIDVITGNSGDVNEITFIYSSGNKKVNIERKAPFNDKERR